MRITTRTTTQTSIHTIIMLIGVLFVMACSSTIQTATISEAYKKYGAQKYSQTLALISRAEKAKTLTPEIKAELTFLKAKTYEGLGQTIKAKALYSYLKQEHKDSQYSYLANKKLEAL